MQRTLFVSVLLAFALTACGKKEDAAPAPAAVTPAPATAPADAAKPADPAPAQAPASQS
jgi:hypothetical protein